MRRAGGRSPDAFRAGFAGSWRLAVSPSRHAGWSHASDRLDRVLTHSVLGNADLPRVMFLMFQSIFLWAKPLMDLIDSGAGWLGEEVESVMSPGPLRRLLADGVINGVGSVLVFLPQIMILFGFIAVLEDCGYMARAAFLMDRLMSRCGLNGKSFIPLLSSVACAVPGIMATRVIENRRDRLATILVAPLMSCSARLPVYMLLIGDISEQLPVVGARPGAVRHVHDRPHRGPAGGLGAQADAAAGRDAVFVMELPAFTGPASQGSRSADVSTPGWAFVPEPGPHSGGDDPVWALLYFPYRRRTGSLLPAVEDAEAVAKDATPRLRDCRRRRIRAKRRRQTRETRSRG